MEYMLVAKCELCGTSVIHEGDTKSERSGYTINLIAQKAGLNLIQDIIMCSLCLHKYTELRQRHKAEMTDFLKREKEK